MDYNSIETSWMNNDIKLQLGQGIRLAKLRLVDVKISRLCDTEFTLQKGSQRP